MITHVRVQLRGTWYELTYDPATGYYTGQITPDAVSGPEPGGYFNVTAEASNLAGETVTVDGEDFPGLRLVVKEGVPPTLTLISPAEGPLTTNTPTFILEATDTGSGIEPDALSIALDGEEYPYTTEAIPNGWRAAATPVEPLSEGAHTLTASVTDRDGNRTELTARYVVDTAPPVLTLPPEWTRKVVDTPTLEVHGTAADDTTGVASVTVTGGTEPVIAALAEDGHFTAVVPLGIGGADLTVTATDNVGWTSSSTFRVYRLITDRTGADLGRLQALCRKGWEAMTEPERAEYQALAQKGAYNDNDLNRVESAVELLAGMCREFPEYLRAYGAALMVAWDGYYMPPYDPEAMTLNTKNDWTERDIPPESELRRYYGNVAALKDAMPTETPELPGSAEHLTTGGANALELALVGLDGALDGYAAATKATLDRVPLAFIYSGEVTAGEY